MLESYSKDQSKTVLSKFKVNEPSPRSPTDTIFGNRKVNQMASKKLREIIRLQSQRKTLKSAISKEEEARILEEEFKNIENMMLTLKPIPKEEEITPSPQKKSEPKKETITSDSMCLEGKKYECQQRQKMKLKLESHSRPLQ